MNFAETLAWLTQELVKSTIIVYHLSMESAEQRMKASDFYGLLSDEQTGWWKDSVEKNFQRYQNEIEYGAWNKDGHDGAAE